MTPIKVSTLSPSQKKLIVQVTSKLTTLEMELNQIFPGRSHLIRASILALASGEHVLMYGPAGTAKTLFMKTVLGAFPDAKIFNIMLTAQTPPSHLIGTQILKGLDNGIVDFNVQNSLVSCDFGMLDEFGNMNPMTQVSLNTILFERMFQHGTKTYPANLMTAFAASNLTLKEFGNDPRVLANLDRFRFRADVQEITNRPDVAQMIIGSLGDEPYKVQTQISTDEIRTLQAIFKQLNFIGSTELVSAYLDVVEEVEKAFGINLTGRSTVKNIQIMETIAFLDGQDEVHLDDLTGLLPAFTDGSDLEKVKTFNKIVSSTIKKYNDLVGKQVDGVEKALIAQLTNKLPNITKNSTTDEVIVAIRTVEEITIHMGTIKQPQLNETQESLNELKSKVEETNLRIKKYISQKGI